MPLKLNLGVCRKVGQPDYGSLGASCSVELEVDSSLLQNDLDSFHREVRQAYVACQQAVNDELARSQQSNSSTTSADRSRSSRSGVETQTPAEATAEHNHNGARQATEKQLGYIRQLSGQIKGVGVRRLDTLSGNMYGKPLAALTSFEASGVIDCLKGIKAGEIDLHTALNGAKT